MSRAQMTVLAVVVGIAIFLGVAVTLALVVFSVMSTRDMVRLDSQVRELTSVVAVLKQSLQEASSSSQLHLEILNLTLEEKTTSMGKLLETVNDSCSLSISQLENKVSSNHEMLIQGGFPQSCQDYRDQGFQESGVYTVSLGDVGGPFQVYCDLDSDSHAWLVFQRRVDGSEDFYRTWADYKAGFGRLEAEFWLGMGRVVFTDKSVSVLENTLQVTGPYHTASYFFTSRPAGNDKLHRLTSAGLTRLRVDLGDWQNNTAYALYSSFSVAGEGNNYRLNVTGYDNSSSAGDSLALSNGYKFSTWDRDGGTYGNCVQYTHAGAWWHNFCTQANLNGVYKTTSATDQRAVFWYTWKNQIRPLKSTEMKIR